MSKVQVIYVEATKDEYVFRVVFAIPGRPRIKLQRVYVSAAQSVEEATYFLIDKAIEYRDTRLDPPSTPEEDAEFKQGFEEAIKELRGEGH